MSVNGKLTEFWEKRIGFEPLIAKRRAWDLESFARDKRQAGLVFRIKSKSVIHKLLELNHHLSVFECYNPFPVEHFHITLKILGTISSEKESPRDYTLRDIDDIILGLKSIFAWFKSFKAQIRMINLFPSVLFAQVHDGGKLNELNRIICETKGIITYPDRDTENYIPHIALGNFKNSDIAGFIKAVEENRDLNFGTVEVNSIDLVKVDLTQPVPVFETLDTIKFAKLNRAVNKPPYE